MEDLLLTIIQDANSARLTSLKDTTQVAYDKLINQQFHRDPSYDLRQTCFMALKLALDSKKQKFITHAINGVHRMMRDDRFFLTPEPEDDSTWFPAQLLVMTADMPITANEENVVNMLRLFLAMACTPACTLNGRLLIDILQRCGECWEKGVRSVKAASLASASQCLRAFCNFLKEESDEIARAAPMGTSTMGKGYRAAVYNEVIPLMQYLTSRINEINTGSPSKSETPSFQFLLECILTLTASIPKESQYNPHFTAFLWQKFCPNLAAVLGFPSRVNLDKKITYKEAIHIIESENRGFYIQKNVTESNSRCIYLTAIELLRIAGFQASLRPMLEALFHRMLLLPPTQHRYEPLKYVREIFKNPERVVDMSVLIPNEKTQSAMFIGSDDMALFRLIMDSMQDCATAAKNDASKAHVLEASVECLVALLSSLQKLISECGESFQIEEEVVKAVNARYITIKQADYKGPLTYQMAVRLPKVYREQVAELRKGNLDGVSTSDSDVENVDPENVSINSGDTEGPEEEIRYSSDNESGRDERWTFNASDVWPDGDYDRHHARDFAKIITEDLVPKLIQLKNTVEIDEYLQDFASNICQQNTSNFSDFDYNLTAINADGIYLATFSAILLGLQLSEAGHYDNPDKPIQIPLTEQQFVQSVQNSGILVCLSCSWLRELYQSVLSSNPLQHLKKQDMSSCALIDLLYDAGGLGSEQMMTNWQKLQCVTRIKMVDTEQQNAGKKLARRLLTCCWDSMLEILTTGLSVIKESRSGRLMKLTKKPLTHEKTPVVNKKALYISSLDGLHAAATLTNALNLQHLSGKILHLIATNACQNVGPKIPVSQALSMNVVLTGALELGAQNPECWLPVFTICRHITKLEHALFSSQNSSNNHVGGVSGKKGTANKSDGTKENSGTEDLKLKYSTYSTDDDEMAVDVYSFLQAPMSNPNTDVESILKSYQESTEILTLTEADTAKILCALSLQADSLFIEAADKLSLPSLCQFLKNLCRASRDQLNGNLISNKKDKDSKSTSWWDFTNWKQKVDKAPPSLLLHRIGDVTLKIFRGTRPLLHILKIWAITGPYLMDAACHKDRTISKKAIENIHDVIVAVLVEQTELPYFHFNEALMKPFENLMTMEQCDIDVVDQIIACLMSLVETYRVEIQSAWRPLFGTLRAARNRPVHLPNILDIFRVFLDWDNTIVFSYAGLDFIICLLSYLEVSSGNGDVDEAVKNKNLDFLHEVLKHLERCTLILEYMYNMPKCPNLLTSFKLNGINYTHLVDSTILGSIDKFYYFGNRYFEDYEDQYMISYKALNVTDEELRNINELDKASGVLKVWFLLLDGLTNSLIVCPVAHQCMILQTIFKLFKQLKQSPGLEFGFYCLNHLLIPTIQDWVRYTNKQKKPWAPIEKNFKHCCGMTTDLVVEFIECSIDIQVYNRSMHYRNGASDEEEITYRAGRARYSKSAVLALKQLLLVLVECASQSQETVARVGVSCMKHIIFSIGHNFEEEEWNIVTSAIHRAITVSSAPVKQLLLAFKRRSDSFYGDNATVKVVARNDTTFDEILRLKSLSDQVFLLDGQRESSSKKEISILDDRSYAFLLFSNLDGDPDHNLDSYKVRIAYRSIVVGLLANQMLLQLIANILLGDLKNAPLELHNVIYDHYMSREKIKFEVDVKSREILLRCLRQYLTISIEFDSRPGLKFLLQKIANIDHAPNLYKQLTSSFIIYFMTLVDAYLNDIKMYNLSVDDIRYVLDTCSNKNSNVVKKKEYFVKYLFLLKDIWNDISKLYLCLINTCATNSSSTNNNNNNSPSNNSNKINNNNNNNNTESNNCDIVHVSLKAEGLSTVAGSDATQISSSINHSTSSLPTTASSCDEAIYSDNNQSPVNQSPTKQDPGDDTSDYHSKRGSPDKHQAIPPEIEQQRQTSMFKDATYKRTVLAQLIKASMELLRFLPEQSTENLKLLLSPAIKESFLIVESQNL